MKINTLNLFRSALISMALIFLGTEFFGIPVGISIFSFFIISFLFYKFYHFPLPDPRESEMTHEKIQSEKLEFPDKEIPFAVLPKNNKQKLFLSAVVATSITILGNLIFGIPFDEVIFGGIVFGFIFYEFYYSRYSLSDKIENGNLAGKNMEVGISRALIFLKLGLLITAILLGILTYSCFTPSIFGECVLLKL